MRSVFRVKQSLHRDLILFCCAENYMSTSLLTEVSGWLPRMRIKYFLHNLLNVLHKGVISCWVEVWLVHWLVVLGPAILPSFFFWKNLLFIQLCYIADFLQNVGSWPWKVRWHVACHGTAVWRRNERGTNGFKQNARFCENESRHNSLWRHVILSSFHSFCILIY